MVFPFLAVGIRQPGHSPNRHADRKVRPLRMARANSGFERGTDSDHFVRAYYFPRRVAARGAGLGSVAVRFDQLSEVDVLSEDERNGRPVRRESIGRKLEPTGRRVVELRGKAKCCGRGPLVQVPREDQFRVPF